MDSTFDRSAMSDRPTMSFAAMLAPVRAAFLDSLPGHIACFEQYRAASTEDERSGMEKQLARRAHKIVGIAETLGFRRLGILAADLEVALTDGGALTTVSSLVSDTLSEMRAAISS